MLNIAESIANRYSYLGFNDKDRIDSENLSSLDPSEVVDKIH